MLVLSVLLSASSLNGGGGGGGGTADQHTITVTGSGRVTLKPDVAMINIGVHTENADVEAALAENNIKAQALRATLEEQGILSADIQTTSFSIYQNPVYGSAGESQGFKYMVDNTVYITLRDLSKMGQVLTAVVNSGANNIYGINFDVSDRSAALSQARLAAMADARSQAEELAQALGSSVGQVITITCNTNTYPASYSYPYGYGGGGGAEGAPSVPVSSGQMTVSVDVYNTYALEK
jgi:uncharacterized protein YggE